MQFKVLKWIGMVKMSDRKSERITFRDQEFVTSCQDKVYLPTFRACSCNEILAAIWPCPHLTALYRKDASEIRVGRIWPGWFRNEEDHEMPKLLNIVPVEQDFFLKNVDLPDEETD
jgi:hypothetical protein